MSSQKGFAPVLVILGLVVILGIAGGAYYLGTIKNKSQPQNPTVTSQTPSSPIPNETTNWKTYTNIKSGFSFKYPSGFTLTKEEKTFEGNRKNLDGQTVNETQYFFSFTTGKMLNGELVGDPGLKGEWQDISGFGISIIPTNGKGIVQAYDNKLGNLRDESTKVTLLDKIGNADEFAKYSGAGQTIRILRYGNYFIEVIWSQNSSTLPDGSNNIVTYIDQILSTFKFTQ